jgi:hypothetical protein
MSERFIFSIVDTPTHPAFSVLYRELGFQELRLESQRKAISALKKQKPEFVVAEFVYTYHTYYQAVSISNLDVFLNSLVKYSPDTRVIVLVNKSDRAHVDALNDIVPLHAVLTLPVSEAQMRAALKEES